MKLKREIKIGIVAMVSMFGWLHVMADWDEKLEAQQKAQRERAAAVERQRQAQAQSARDGAMVKAARTALGKEAEGKSDAEALRLYDAKMKGHQAAATKAAATAPGQIAAARKTEADTRADRDALMKKQYGKSLKDLEGMSDADLDKFAAEVTKRSGTK